MPYKRGSGVLLHISSLAGEYGIGTLGKSAYEFVDFLKNSNQMYWQILPLCPTTYGDSPYQSYSVFAGNEYFIDLDTLCNLGYLEKSDYENILWSKSESSADYGILYNSRHRVLYKAKDRFYKNLPADFERFCSENSYWLDDYALFRALKVEFGEKALTDWNEKVKERDESTLTALKKDCKNMIDYYKMTQYFFFKQWQNVKNYANKNGIKIIGDMPIYVSGDSADVWANPKNFWLDEKLNPKYVAGCPPDYFSENGQLWGNPVYDFEHMKKDNFKWWAKRFEHCFNMYDIVRVDHFRGFESFYCVKNGEKTAKYGFWKQGIGEEFFGSMKSQLPNFNIIAENLGFITRPVQNLLEKFDFTGMYVLEFYFDSRDDGMPSVEKISKNTAIYTGTHDNDTILGWANNLNSDDLRNVQAYFNTESNSSLVWKMIEKALDSCADICILTMQDLLCLGSESRMNTPSTLGNNWRWRMKKDDIKNQTLIDKLKTITANSKR